LRGAMSQQSDDFVRRSRSAAFLFGELTMVGLLLFTTTTWGQFRSRKNERK
jgi:hypothetical protein